MKTHNWSDKNIAKVDRINVCSTSEVFPKWPVGGQSVSLLATCRVPVASAASIGHPGSTLVVTSRTLWSRVALLRHTTDCRKAERGKVWKSASICWLGGPYFKMRALFDSIDNFGGKRECTKRLGHKSFHFLQVINFWNYNCFESIALK